jgi:hypothetical protein
MCSAASWRIVQPAPPSAGLALASAHPRVRRAVLAQVRSVDSAAVYLGDEVLALAMFGRHGWRRLEMALAIAPQAAPHMRKLVRMAQLTLSAMAETHLIVASIHPANPAGQRMAMLTGFRRARLSSRSLWVFERIGDDGTVRRRQGAERGEGERGRGEGGRAGSERAQPQDAGGGQ